MSEGGAPHFFYSIRSLFEEFRLERTQIDFDSNFFKTQFSPILKPASVIEQISILQNEVDFSIATIQIKGALRHFCTQLVFSIVMPL